MDWRSDLKSVVVRHEFDFDAVAFEIGVPAKAIREEFTRQEFGDGPVVVTEEEPPQSFEAILEADQAREKEHKEKRDAIFDRVLKSLGGGVKNWDDEVAQTWLMERRKTEGDRAIFRARLAERSELLELRREREALRRRYDDDSPDAQGDDPLAGLDDNDVEDHEQPNLDSSGLDAVLDALDIDSGHTCSKELQDLFHLMDSSDDSKSPTTTTSVTAAKNIITHNDAVTSSSSISIVVESKQEDSLLSDYNYDAPKKVVSTSSTSMSTACMRRSMDYGSREEDDDDDEDDDEDWFHASRRSQKARSSSTSGTTAY